MSTSVASISNCIFFSSLLAALKGGTQPKERTAIHKFISCLGGKHIQLFQAYQVYRPKQGQHSVWYWFSRRDIIHASLLHLEPWALEVFARDHLQFIEEMQWQIQPNTTNPYYTHQSQQPKVLKDGTLVNARYLYCQRMSRRMIPLYHAGASAL